VIADILNFGPYIAGSGIGHGFELGTASAILYKLMVFYFESKMHLVLTPLHSSLYTAARIMLYERSVFAN
jgi:hypothetical protein